VKCQAYFTGAATTPGGQASTIAQFKYNFFKWQSEGFDNQDEAFISKKIKQGGLA